jgi:hypothetical protein
VKGEPLMTVSCDRCETYEDEYGLTSLARGGWDDRNVQRQMERNGWKTIDGEDICPDCQEAADSDA